MCQIQLNVAFDFVNFKIYYLHRFIFNLIRFDWSGIMVTN